MKVLKLFGFAIARESSFMEFVNKANNYIDNLQSRLTFLELDTMVLRSKLKIMKEIYEKSLDELEESHLEELRVPLELILNLTNQEFI